MSTTPKRRKDGTLRPAVVRARQRRRALLRGEGVITAAMLTRFNTLGRRECAIWNSHDLRERLDADKTTLGKLLEEVAEEHRWLKLRDTLGVVRAIALPQNHPDRAALTPHGHREAMLTRILARGLAEASV